MKTKAIGFAILFSLLPVMAYGEGPLTVLVDDQGCPTAVRSNDESCNPGQADALNVACRSSGAVVRFQSDGNAIQAIAAKAGSPGTMHNCRIAGPNYQCVVQGNVDDHIDYDVTLEGCSPLDPTIIIK